MNEEEAAIARRWRNARGFVWMRGMSFTSKLGRGTITDVSLFAANYGHHDTTLPDITDKLTRAAALLMFRAAYADDGAYVMRDGDEWVAWAEIDGIPGVRDGVGMGPTEIEALIHALEAAPEKT
jgi:hypothetical protein